MKYIESFWLTSIWCSCLFRVSSSVYSKSRFQKPSEAVAIFSYCGAMYVSFNIEASVFDLEVLVLFFWQDLLMMSSPLYRDFCDWSLPIICKFSLYIRQSASLRFFELRLFRWKVRLRGFELLQSTSRSLRSKCMLSRKIRSDYYSFISRRLGFELIRPKREEEVSCGLQSDGRAHGRGFVLFVNIYYTRWRIFIVSQIINQNAEDT